MATKKKLVVPSVEEVDAYLSAQPPSTSLFQHKKHTHTSCPPHTATHQHHIDNEVGNDTSTTDNSGSIQLPKITNKKEQNTDKRDDSNSSTELKGQEEEALASSADPKSSAVDDAITIEPSTSTTNGSSSNSNTSNTIQARGPTNFGKGDLGTSTTNKLPIPSKASVVVSGRQKGNPVLKHLRNIRYEFGELKADYDLGGGCCALYLSIKFHKRHPDYIHVRFKEVGHSYALQVVLVHLDVEPAEGERSLKELNRMCALAGWTMILTYSSEEVAEYLESFKIYESKPSYLVRGTGGMSDVETAIAFLTSIRTVTKPDATRLIEQFKSLSAIAQANVDSLSLIHGISYQKALRIYQTFRENFINESRDDDADF